MPDKEFHLFAPYIMKCLAYIVGKAFHNVWSKQMKFFIRHKVMRKPYPENIVKYVMENMDQGIGWYDTKKSLMIKMMPQAEINETLWIYDQLLNQLARDNKNKQKEVKR